MKILEKFLNSPIYPLLMAVGAAVGWYFDGDLFYINYSFITAYLVIGVILLSLFKDTKHVIPVLLGLLFMINTKRIGMDVLQRFSIAYVIAGLGFLGVLIHFVRFRHKFKFSWVSLSFLLIAISYLIPLIYTEITIVSIMLSLSGLIYFVLYSFFKDSTEAKLDVILNYLFYASLTIILQLSYRMGYNFIKLQVDNDFIETLKLGIKKRWGGGDYGYGNLNSLIIYLTILSSGTLYKIIKKPYNPIYWFVMIISIFIVLFSGSRGGFLSWIALTLIYIAITGAYGKLWQMFLYLGIIFVILALGVIFKDVTIEIYKVLTRGGLDDLDRLSAGRITLFKKGYEVFKQRPLFGSGWTHAYEPEGNNPTRVMIYHSTIIQTLAMTGLFGLTALFIHFISIIGLTLKKFRLEVALVFTVWVVTTLHGMIDNTMHLPIYMFLTIIIISGIERENDRKLSSLKNGFYPLNKLYTENKFIK